MVYRSTTLGPTCDPICRTNLIYHTLLHLLSPTTNKQTNQTNPHNFALALALSSLLFTHSPHSQYSPLNLCPSHSSYILLFSPSLPAAHILAHTSSCSLNPGFGSQTGLASQIFSSAEEGERLCFQIKYAARRVAERDLPIAQWMNSAFRFEVPKALVGVELVASASASSSLCGCGKEEGVVDPAASSG